MRTGITFLGAGNIARAIVGGLIASGSAGDDIICADPTEEARTAAQKLGVLTSQDNIDAVSRSELIVVAVKPNIVEALGREISGTLADRLLISVAAGITTSQLCNWFGTDRVIRCMPNTPATIRRGMTGLFATPAVSQTQKTAAESILAAVGSFVWVEDETLLNAITAVSGSGPAYFFYFMEAMEQHAQQLGLSPEVASILVRETALGAALMVSSPTQSISDLRRQVTSPGGTTEAAINSMTADSIDDAIGRAIMAANRRSVELAG